MVYVLNSGGSGSISGFRLGKNDKLTPIPNSTRPLSSMTAGAAQISFVNNGMVLVITEKATNKIITYTVTAGGVPGMMHSITSSNATPFGFAVGKNQVIYVSEAAGGMPNASSLSSYIVNNNGMIQLATGPIAAGQTAACWVVLTDDNKYLYTTNTGSGNLSSFETGMGGGFTLLNSIAAVTGMATSPIDAALSESSEFLYVLNAGNETISVFSVNNNGSLSHLQNIGGLPDGATGLAAD